MTRNAKCQWNCWIDDGLDRFRDIGREDLAFCQLLLKVCGKPNLPEWAFSCQNILGIKHDLVGQNIDGRLYGWDSLREDFDVPWAERYNAKWRGCSSESKCYEMKDIQEQFGDPSIIESDHHQRNWNLDFVVIFKIRSWFGQVTSVKSPFREETLHFSLVSFSIFSQFVLKRLAYDGATLCSSEFSSDAYDIIHRAVSY